MSLLESYWLLLNHFCSFHVIYVIIFFSNLQAQIGSSSSDDQQRTPGAAQYYTGSRQSGTAGIGDQGMFSSYQAGSVPVGLYAVQRENVFPERPDQPECQFYMKTGDCKFGAVCKFHHPRERIIPTPNCALSPLGLPLRPVRVSIHVFKYALSCVLQFFGQICLAMLALSL